MTELPNFQLTQSPSIIDPVIGIEARLLTSSIVYYHKNKLYNYQVNNNDEFVDKIKEINKIIGNIKLANITGDNSNWVKNILKKEFNIESKYVSKAEAIELGLKLITESSNITKEDIYFNTDDPLVHNFTKYHVDPDNPFMKAMMHKFKLLDEKCKLSNLTLENLLIKPKSLLILTDEFTEFYFYDMDCKIYKISSSSSGNSIIRGFSKVMINNNNFDEICRLSLKGRRENVDTQVYEILSDNKDSPYGTFPKEAPTFHFGKGMDKNIGIGDADDADFMTSLTSLVFSDILTTCGFLMNTFSTNRVYLCGPTLKQPIFLKHLLFRQSFIHASGIIQILDMNYLLSLGALLLQQEQQE